MTVKALDGFIDEASVFSSSQIPRPIAIMIIDVMTAANSLPRTYLLIVSFMLHLERELEPRREEHRRRVQ